MNCKPNLRILQYNNNGQSKVMLPLLEDDEVKEFDIIAIQEPSWNPATQTSHNSNASRFHLAHRSGQDTRTCFYINKKADGSEK